MKYCKNCKVELPFGQGTYSNRTNRCPVCSRKLSKNKPREDEVIE